MESTIKKVENGFEVTSVMQGQDSVVDVFTTLEEAMACITQKFTPAAAEEGGEKVKEGEGDQA